jgi:CheY-like chemotaxis protein
VRESQHPICAILIDDDPDVLFLVERALKRTGRPVEVMAFACPQEALEFFERLAASDFPLPDPTIVFCDIRMPAINGFDVIERIRAIQKFDGLRIYLISMSFQLVDRARAVAVGVDGHLDKFPSPEQFNRVLGSA